MPLPPRKLPDQLVSQLNEFIQSNDLTELYTSYIWGNDTFQDGFPDILKLEVQLTESDKKQGIRLRDVKDVARWGKLRNIDRIDGEDIVLPKNTLNTAAASPVEALTVDPLKPITKLQENIYGGVGPTYLSKVLRFGLPQEYGAIDTRCVRVFGQGDSESQRHDWLKLRVRNDGYGWYIPKNQAGWPSEYGMWIEILRYFSKHLPSNCPHPEDFIAAGLRSGYEWACADVEMALFTYAKRHKTRGCRGGD